MRPAEVRRQQERIKRAFLVVRGRAYPFSEDVIVDETGAVDPTFGIKAKVSFLTNVLRLGGSFELVNQFRAQFTLTAVRFNVDVSWSRDEVLVSISFCSVLSTCPVCIQFVGCLFHHTQWYVNSDLVSLHQLGKITRSCGMEFDELGDEVRVFPRVLDKDYFRIVCVTTLDRYSSYPHQQVSRLSRLMDALGPNVSVVSVSGGSTKLIEAFCEYLGSGFCQKFIDCPSFDLRLFERCLQRTAFSVLRSLDGFAMTEFTLNWPTGAETRDWMSSLPALKKAILTNALIMPHLVDVVVNIIGVWPLIVSYLKETGRENEGDCPVVGSSYFVCRSAISEA